MDLPGLLDALARSGLDDGEYASAVAAVRALAARADAGAELATVILANECYQPEAVLSACGRFYLAEPIQQRAA